MVDFFERDVSKELAHDDWKAYHRIGRNANINAVLLKASWQHASDHDRDTERVALWRTVVLDMDCAEALEPGHMLRLWPPGVNAATRYALQSSIRMVHASLPFTSDEREALGKPLLTWRNHYPEYESDELPRHEPELVEHWHRWLWLDELGMPQHDAEARAGPSVVLAEACVRLDQVIDAILEDPAVDPL